MGDGLAQVAVVALLAVVAVTAGRVVATVKADAPALAPRQLVKLHVEAAPPGMQVAVTGCGKQGHGSGGGHRRPWTSPPVPPPPQSDLKAAFPLEAFPRLPCLHPSPLWTT